MFKVGDKVSNKAGDALTVVAVVGRGSLAAVTVRDAQGFVYCIEAMYLSQPK